MILDIVSNRTVNGKCEWKDFLYIYSALLYLTVHRWENLQWKMDFFIEGSRSSGIYSSRNFTNIIVGNDKHENKSKWLNKVYTNVLLCALTTFDFIVGDQYSWQKKNSVAPMGLEKLGHSATWIDRLLCVKYVFIGLRLWEIGMLPIWPMLNLGI